MLVRVKKSQLAYFRSKARRCFPNEIFAVLLGKQIHKSLIEIYEFVYPKLEESDYNHVLPDVQSLTEIEEYARQMELKWLGDIHSHPNYLPVMSPADHEGHKAVDNRVSAIVEVPEQGRTRVVFWRHDTSLPCKLEYFK